MRTLPTIMLVTALAVTTAWAQVNAGMTTSTTTTATTMTCQVACPTTAYTLPIPCPGILTQNLHGDMVIMVLGSEEQFALENMPVANLNWRDTTRAYSSQFENDYPLLTHRPNRVVLRHGNPYFPYYQINTTTRVAGIAETFGTPPTAEAQFSGILQGVTDRYRGLTVHQAAALGYQCQSVAGPGGNLVFLNSALIDNTFNPMQPEAFIYSPDGRLLGMQYIIRSDQRLAAFGQPMQPSFIVPGAQQLTAWLFAPSSDGIFAALPAR